MITHDPHIGWILRSHRGKILGVHPTHKKALAQERAINIAKARAAGHRIPRRPRSK
jgi:hypothetical protein